MQLQGMLRFKMGWAEAEGAAHDVVLSSRVRLARNLKGLSFPSRGAPDTLRDVLASSLAAARKAPGFAGAAFIKLADLDELDRSFLFERHLISPRLAENPSGRGVVIGHRELLSLMINEEDHLRLSSVGPGLSLKDAWERADALDDSLEERLDYAYNEDWGYLTACPTNLGTAMRASCLVHLPALGLAGLLKQVFDRLTRSGHIVRGLYGEGTKVLGDFYQVSNATGLGLSEIELVKSMEKAVYELTGAETECRDDLAAGSDKLKLEDMVFRSVGALTRSRLLSFEEASRHLSLLRMGLTLGWEVPGNIAVVNELTISTQPAHLRMLVQKEVTDYDLSRLRASLLRRRLGADDNAQ